MANVISGSEVNKEQPAKALESTPVKVKLDDLNSSKLHLLGIGANANSAMDDDTKEDFYQRGNKSTNLKDSDPLPPLQGSADRKLNGARKKSISNFNQSTAEKDISLI